MKQTLANLLYSDPAADGLYRHIPPDTPRLNNESRLIQQVLSKRTSDRIRVAASLASLPGSHYYFVVRLLQDEDATVRQTVLLTLGYQERAALLQELVEAIGEIETRRVAAAMLVALGTEVIPLIRNEWQEANQSTRMRFIRILERIGSSQALALLADELAQTDEVMRTLIVRALKKNGYLADASSADSIGREIDSELNHAAGLLASLLDLATAPESSLDDLEFLNNIINTQLNRCRQRISAYVGLLEVEDKNPPSTGLYQEAQQFLQATATEQQWQSLQMRCASSGLSWVERLLEMLNQSDSISDPWLWVCTAYSAIKLDLNEPNIIAALSNYQQNHPHNRLVMETINVAMAKLNKSATHHQYGYQPMFSTIEKVIFLKGVNLFYETPDAILIELASLLEEIIVPADSLIFEKGASADCMYIIVEGRVKVHDGEQILNDQGRGEVFGELALLDEQPRLASITAIEDTRLLKLDQEGFYLLMEDHIEFVRGVIRVLSGYLRGNLRNITDPEFKLSAQTFKQMKLAN